jgi:hypothetical protein
MSIIDAYEPMDSFDCGDAFKILGYYHNQTIMDSDAFR